MAYGLFWFGSFPLVGLVPMRKEGSRKADSTTSSECSTMGSRSLSTRVVRCRWLFSSWTVGCFALYYLIGHGSASTGHAIESRYCLKPLPAQGPGDNVSRTRSSLCLGGRDAQPFRVSIPRPDRVWYCPKGNRKAEWTGRWRVCYSRCPATCTGLLYWHELRRYGETGQEGRIGSRDD